MAQGKKSGNSILRAAFVGISLLFQIGWLLLLIIRLNEHFAWISLVTGLLALTVVLRLYSKHTTSAMKMPWIMLILVFPVMGLSLYLLIVIFGDSRGICRRLRAIREKQRPYRIQSPQALELLESAQGRFSNQVRYLSRFADSPVYGNTAVTYYPQAAQAFEALKQALESAERFIFMEYFIVNDTSSFREIRQILERKVREGVEVRLLYDDVGSVGYVNLAFARELCAAGIRCRAFNPAVPFLNLFLNHRDHRKITVIDGKVGFTGGYNLSDEYFGRAFPYGKWKDTGVRLEGEAVRSLTSAFLEMWSISSRDEEDMTPYLDIRHVAPGTGLVQPYADDPLGPERVAENVYLNLIHSAEKQLYIMTPYLIITDEMRSALGLAAKRGVDVRIVTPGIPDKKTVYSVTRSYYGELARQGVRIFEWTPGFCHAKQCLCDSDLASIGTSNLDYRSLYLHFENNVLLWDCQAVRDMEADFRDVFSQSREVTEEYAAGRGAVLRTWQCILRLFAHMM